MKIIDNGIDLDRDGHCDNCGWFVDRYGHHRARAVFQHVNEEIQLSWNDEDIRLNNLNLESFVSEFYEGKPYNMYTNQTYRLWPLIKRYSLNDPDQPLSCKSLNDFLRYEIVNPKTDAIELMDTALSMNLAISKFRLKKNLITYRGLSFGKNDDFIRMLDNAYVVLRNSKIYPFIDNGFVSTTRDINYAKTVMLKNKKEVYVLCSYISLAGTHCMPLSEEWGTTIDDSEKEVLFKSMQKYYICGIQKYRVGNISYYNCIIINSKEKIHD